MLHSVQLVTSLRTSVKLPQTRPWAGVSSWHHSATNTLLHVLRFQRFHPFMVTQGLTEHRPTRF